MNKIQRKRFVNLIKAVEEGAKKSTKFNMRTWGHPSFDDLSCGTPACALGHYADRRDLQKTFILNTRGTLCLRSTDEPIHLSGTIVSKHFGITLKEELELFDSRGCGNAGTNRQAAVNYLKKFLAKKCNEVKYDCSRDGSIPTDAE